MRQGWERYEAKGKPIVFVLTPNGYQIEWL